MVWSVPALATGAGKTVRVMVSESWHMVVPLVMVIIYVVVEAGDAVGCEILVALKPVAGDQLYV